MLEHEGTHVLAVNAKCLNCGRPSADEIPHGLVTLVRNPNRGKFARAKQPGQRQCISAIRLYPVARPSRYQRRRYHGSFVAKQMDQAIETITGRACLVAEMDTIKPGGDPLDNAVHARIRRINLPEEANLSPRPASAIAMAFLSFAKSIPTMLPYNLPRLVLL